MAIIHQALQTAEMRNQANRLPLFVLPSVSRRVGDVPAAPSG
jgi:hypothetical protein